jgi:hypothetical protein
MRFQLTQQKQPHGMNAGDKRRLVLLIGGLVVVSGILFSTLRQANKAGARPAPQPIVDESAPSAPLLAVPELDLARVNALVREQEPADQVVLDSEAADLVLGAARRYTARHFVELGARELDRGVAAELGAAPAAARGKPFTARGRIRGLRERSGAAHETQYLGTLELDDGGTAHFLALAVPEDAAALGGYVRIDGLFLKVYSTEDELAPGTWHAGPLLIGPAAVRSYPNLGTVTTLDLDALAELEDANLSPDPGQAPKLVTETPSEPLWELMAYARDLPAEALHWADAPELDQRLLDQLLEKPAEFRALPVRLPISRLQDGRVCVADENPARLSHYTQGWIGNVTWKGAIHFKTPVLRPELKIGDLVTGHGFFLHDFSYESSERGLRIAPVFVLQSLERFVPQPSVVLTRIPLLVGGLGLFLLILFVVLAKRDKQRTSAFYEELVRRRRARQAKNGVGTAAP